MRKASKRLSVAVLAMCMLVALAFGGVAAWAADSGLGGSNSLTVKVSDDPESDIAKAGVKVSVYKIADAKKNTSYDIYDYTFVAPFAADLTSKYPLANMSASQWEGLAGDAKTIVEAEDSTAQAVVSDVLAGDAITGLTDGLYLVLAPDTAGAEHMYSFSPAVVAIPNKASQVVEGREVIMTSDDYGAWLNEVSITLKHSEAPLYGSLRINKTVTNFSGEPATFVFHITGTTPAGTTYERYASVYYSGGESASTVVNHIPVGTKLKVTEEYTGARFALVTGDDEEKTIVADEDQMAHADFTNRQTSSGTGGHGIQNSFTLQQDGEDESHYDWMLEVTPDTSQMEKPAQG